MGCDKTGAMGPEGLPGARGEKGVRGDAGAAGEKGAKGDRGDTGAGGPTGVKGPKGDRGDTGAQGPAGPRGEQGPAGVGNVIYSDWIRPSSTNVTREGELVLNVPRLTASILNTGEVYVFMRYQRTGEVFPLEGHMRSYYGFRHTLDVGRITVYAVPVLAARVRNGIPVVQAITGLLPLVPAPVLLGASAALLQDPNPLPDYDYRYVLIPGGAQATSRVDMTDYSQVQGALGIKN